MSNDWLKLIKEERQLRARVFAGAESADATLHQQWWSAVAVLLHGMVRPSGQFAEELPMEMFDTLGGLAKYLAAGHVPLPISKVAAKGRSRPGPTEVRNIRAAVTYRLAVKSKLIDDPRPIQTIVKAYGLRSPRTVQQWCERYEPLDFSLWVRNPRALTRRMRSSGEYYRRANQYTWAHRTGSRRARPARK